MSGFGAGNNMIDVILAMPFNFIISSNLSFVLSKYPVFIMAMPLNMILVMYVIPCILSHDFFNKLTILYIHVHISLSFLGQISL